MNALQLPVIPMGEPDSGQGLVFLPGVDTEDLEGVDFQVRDEEDLLYVYCVYGENEEGEPVGDAYPIEINDVNRERIQGLQQLAVLHPDDQDVDELTDDPTAQDELEELFDHIKTLEQEMAPPE